MTGLPELFERVAEVPSPPSNLIADEIYTAGRRRHRRRRAAFTSGAVALAVATISAIGLMNVRTVPREAEQVTPAGPSTSSTGETHHAGQIIQWAGAGDAQHLYLTFMACQTPTTACPKTRVQMVGSDDGGRTWTDRGPVINSPGLTVVGPNTLIGTLSTPTITVDGGRTWSTAAVNSQVATEVPAGGTAACWAGPKVNAPCKLYAIDPGNRRFAPLATQPELTLANAAEVSHLSGNLWVGGIDPATGKPAAAVSTDAGRTWSTHVFADLTQCTPSRCQAPQLATLDGERVFAVITDTNARQRFVYRGALGGPWQRYGVTTSMPYGLSDDIAARSFVTRDGTYVLCQSVAERQDPDSLQCWTTQGATTAYQQVELPGLPATVSSIRRTPDGWFYTVDNASNVLYGSADGRHWTAVTSR
jgi:hypothetical protein